MAEANKWPYAPTRVSKEFMYGVRVWMALSIYDG